MKIFRGFDNVDFSYPSVVTIGTYDGIHKGHIKVLEKLVLEARYLNCKSIVITFFPHPRHVLYPDQKDLKLIDTEEEKHDKFIKLGVDVLIIIPFTKSFSEIPYITFVEDYLVKKLKILKFVLGKDHRFGKNREGNFEEMRKLSELQQFTIDYVPTYEYHGIEVSSTKIRKAIAMGNIALANLMLGNYFSIKAKVVEGRKIGNSIGFPTANLSMNDALKLLPPIGVYAVKVKHGNGFFYGMLNIGKNPTINYNDDLKIEVHILDFNEMIYGATIELFFVERVRDEMKFGSLDLLKTQLKKDKEKIIELLSGK